MTGEEFDRMLRKIDEVIGPPGSESREARRRLAARARRRRLRLAGAAHAASGWRAT